MKETINQIEAVKVVNQLFDVEIMQPGISWVTELYEDCIVTYNCEFKSLRRLGVSRTPVSKDEMRRFFTELYEFARTAESSCDLVDDCSHKVTYIYNPYHKEVFEGGIIRGDELLENKIEEFVNRHRKS